MIRFALSIAVVWFALSLSLTVAIVRSFSASAPAANHIVYAWSNDSTSGAIMLVSDDINGMTPHPLRDDGAELLRPTCAANGQVFAYIARSTIHAINADGRERAYPLSSLPVNTSQVQALSLADDGQTALVSFASDTYQYPLYQIDLVSGESRRVYTPSDYAVLPALSPDGRRTALVIGDSSRFRRMGMVVIDVQPADRLPVSDHLWIADSATTPAWSPDGGAVTFTRYQAGRYTLTLVDVNHSTSHALLSRSSIFDPVWSPDGRQIIFVTIVNGEERIARVDLTARRRGIDRQPVLLPHDRRDLLRFAPCVLTFVPTRLLG